LFNTHTDKGTEKWEIYAWAVRDLIAKVGGFGKHDMQYREKIQYFKYVNGLSKSYIYDPAQDTQNTKKTK
jgi:hypothetical protein